MSMIRPDQLADRILGIHLGTVLDNKDPEGIGRIKVKYVVPSGEIEAAWARQITIMGGPKMGFVCYPEPEDEVLLRFVNGQPDHPVIVGSTHNGKDVIPFDNADGKNDDRIWWSRSDHHLMLNDTEGDEKISIITKDGKTTWEMMTKPELIEATSTKDIKIAAKNKLTVEAGKDITMKADSNWKGQAGSAYEAKAGSNADLKGSAGVSITAASVSFKN